MLDHARPDLDQVARLRTATLKSPAATRTAEKDQRDRGRYLGGTTPFGYRLGEAGKLAEDPDQQQAIKRMRRLRSSGKSLRDIAEDMKGRGFSISHVGVKKRLGEGGKRP